MTFQRMQLSRKTNMASISYKWNEESRTIKTKLVLSFGVVLFLSPIIWIRELHVFLKAKGYQHARVTHNEPNTFVRHCCNTGIYITCNTALKLRINFPAGQTCCILHVYSMFFVFTTGTECDPFLIKLNSLPKNSNNSMLVEENIFSWR